MLDFRAQAEGSIGHLTVYALVYYVYSAKIPFPCSAYIHVQIHVYVHTYSRRTHAAEGSSGFGVVYTLQIEHNTLTYTISFASTTIHHQRKCT